MADKREFVIEEYDSNKQTKVMAEEIKLKGYSKIKFIAFKDPVSNFWFVHDLIHGKCVQKDTQVTTLASAKQSARAYLEKHTGKNQKLLMDRLVMFPALNSVQEKTQEKSDGKEK